MPHNDKDDGGNEKVLDETQAALYLTVSVSKMRGWRRDGGGPVYIKMDRLVRYNLSDLDSFLLKSRVKKAE